jgi:hypothetical protein
MSNGKMYCPSCKEVMPAVAILTRYLRILATCTHCGVHIKGITPVKMDELGLTLIDETDKPEPDSDKHDLKQGKLEIKTRVDPIALERKSDLKKKEKPLWLREKIKRQYAERAAKRKKESQPELDMPTQLKLF